MEVEQAKPGNTIEITRQDAGYYGKRFLVIDCPDDKRDGPYCNSTWVMHLGIASCIPNAGNYKIVNNQPNTASLWHPMVDQKLKDQRDANLRSVFT